MDNKKNQEQDFDDRSQALNEEDFSPEYEKAVSMGQASEEESRQNKKNRSWRGKTMPTLNKKRDSSQDKDPLTAEQLGMNPEDSFLAEREIKPIDLRKHQDNHQKNFLGANMRRSRDFLRMFDRGVNSKDQPRLDLAYNIEYSPGLKKQLICEQLLRNLQSSQSREKHFANKVLKELIPDEEQREELTENEDFRDEDNLDQLDDFISNEFI